MYFECCPKCGNSEVEMHVQATISAPARFSHNLSKANLRSKDVYLECVNWETADYICRECGIVRDGYGNYVTKLEKQVSKIKELEKDSDRYVWLLSHMGAVEFEVRRWQSDKHKSLLLHLQDFIDAQLKTETVFLNKQREILRKGE